MKKVLSLGAGVQSSALALMCERGVFEKPDIAIFADTGDEPYSVYGWLEHLEGLLSYPVVRVSHGESLRKRSQRVVISKKTGQAYMKGLVPAYVLSPSGEKGILGRKCTYDHKIMPIRKYLKKWANVRRAEKNVIITQYMGISLDEIQRMKPSQVPWIKNTYPLVDAGISRSACKRWLIENRYPEPPRSACYYCPFHSAREWRRLKEDEPDEFLKAVEFERELQRAIKGVPRMDGTPYLYRSCKPLDEIDFGREGQNPDQIDLFGNECEGMCGI